MARRNLGFLKLSTTDRRLVGGAATAALSAVLVETAFDKIKDMSQIPEQLRGVYGLNALKVVGAMVLLQQGGRSDLIKSAAAGMVVSAVYDLSENLLGDILKKNGNTGGYLRGYSPAPRLSQNISPMGLSNNLSGYRPVQADSINVASVV
tara:strand:+ start:244 stop:693 length:450 start_codon:yes stop_codon:yes gene_type:complete